MSCATLCFLCFVWYVFGSVLKVDQCVTNCDVPDSNSIEHVNFEQWMIDNGAKPTLIKVLVDNEIDSIDILRQLKGNPDDIDAIATTCNLNIVQKLKLKAIIEKIPYEYNIIDKEEREAILNIESKIKSIQQSIQTISDTKDRIEDNIQNQKQIIENTFNDIFKVLNDRKETLITELTDIGNAKKQSLEKQKQMQQKHSLFSKEKLSESRLELRKPLQLQQIDARKQKLLSIANEVENIEIIQPNNSLITNYETNVTLNSNELIELLERFGSISLIPILVSLHAEYASIVVEWKFDKHILDEDLNDKQIKIEWSQSKLEKEPMKIEWDNNRVLSINHIDKHGSSVDIKVNEFNTNYFFKISYYDGNEWSKSSNIKSIFFNERDGYSNDSWDLMFKSSDIKISDKHIVFNDGSNDGYWHRILGKKQCKPSTGKYHWTLKLVDVYPISNGLKILVGVCPKDNWDKYSTGGNEQYFYSFRGSNPTVACPEKLTKVTRVYGEKFEKLDDIIDVYLDTNNFTLSYKINGHDYGIACSNLPKTTYRLAVDLCPKRKLKMM
eukprot:183032_1